LCSTPWAPWFVIPADAKWFRNLAVSQVLVEALEAMDPRFPKPAFDLSKIVIE
jgi:polyphosphate kinase 2 (PPK2 family)